VRRSLCLIATGLLLAGCGVDLRGVGGPDLDSNGIAVSGLYPGFYPRSEPGTCAVAGTGDQRTLTFASRETKNLVPRILISLPQDRGAGTYAVGKDAQLTASLGNDLHWEAGSGTVKIEDESARVVHGSVAANLSELASDGFGDRPITVSGRWSCDLRS
jgi:hypothetical protein